MTTVHAPWRWQFPPIDMPAEYMQTQVEHVLSEALEAYNANLNGEGGERIAEELMDTIHAAETALRMLEAEGVDLGEVRCMVIRKNAARGYYGGES